MQSFDRKPVDFDWQLHVPSGIYKAVSKRHHAVMTVYINAINPRQLDRKLIERLLRDLDNDSFQVRQKAKQDLEKLGHDAKPFLRAALKAQPGLEARRRIEGLLEKLRDFDVSELEIPKGITVISVDDLLAEHFTGLKDGDSTVSGMAIQDLSNFAPYSDKVVPAMTEMLRKDKNEWVRRVAAGCLSHVGFQARSALPALKEGLNDPDASIRDTFRITIDQLQNAKDKPGRDDEVRKHRVIIKEINNFKKAAVEK
jgi:HEAT repeat protein